MDNFYDRDIIHLPSSCADNSQVSPRREAYNPGQKTSRAGQVGLTWTPPAPAQHHLSRDDKAARQASFVSAPASHFWRTCQSDEKQLRKWRIQALHLRPNNGALVKWTRRDGRDGGECRDRGVPGQESAGTGECRDRRVPGQGSAGIGEYRDRPNRQAEGGIF